MAVEVQHRTVSIKAFCRSIASVDRFSMGMVKTILYDIKGKFFKLRVHRLIYSYIFCTAYI
jgi:hypothetical protein